MRCTRAEGFGFGDSVHLLLERGGLGLALLGHGVDDHGDEQVDDGEAWSSG